MASIRKRRRARGRTVWIVDYRDATGVRHWVTCATREEAEQARADRVRDSRQARPSPVNPHVTFDEYATAWLEQATLDLAASTRRGYSVILHRHLLPALKAVRVRAIHLGHIKTLLAEKRAAGYGKNMLRLMRATLSVILGDAVEDGLLSANPVSQLARRRRRRDGTVAAADHQKNIRPLSPEQLEAALVAAGKHERRVYPYILTLARAGLRPSEGLALQWDDLDFGGREIRVQRALDAQGRVAPTKTGTARVVDMSVQLAVALQRLRTERAAETLRRGWPARPSWVFRSEVGTPLDLSNVTKAWRRVLKKVKLPAFRLLRPAAHVRDHAPGRRRSADLRGRPDGPYQAHHDAPLVCALAPARGQALGRRARRGEFTGAW